jgi:hypothetical protein
MHSKRTRAGADKPAETLRPPESLWGIAWRLMANPRTAVVVVSLVVTTYLTARVAGYDLMLPILERFRTQSQTSSVDISGTWKYRCATIGRPFREWGGIASIHQEMSPYGIQWKLFGQRLWETSLDKQGKPHKQELLTPLPWETNWGAVTSATSEPMVRYGYRISTPEGTIEGYAYADIITAGTKPSRMVGKFYQLPPFQPLHGRMEFRATVDASDTQW